MIYLLVSMELEYQDWARLQGTEGTTHGGRTLRPPCGRPQMPQMPRAVLPFSTFLNILKASPGKSVRGGGY